MDVINTSQIVSAENNFATYSLNNGILSLHYKSEIRNLAFYMAVDIVETRLNITQGQSFPLFVDLNCLRFADVKTMKYSMSQESTRDVSAIALLVRTYQQKLLTSLFVKVYERKVFFPVEMFYSEEDALEWLKQFIK